MKVDLLPHLVKDLWINWGLELLILLSFSLQIALTVFGNRRKYVPGISVRFIVWSSYILSASVTKLVIGKLTTIQGSERKQHHYDNELKAIFGPLLLLQIGNPDAITAYSIEDNRLGVRQVIGLAFQVVLVMWIMVRNWTNSQISFLYIPLFLCGLIKYGELVWALKTALSKNVGLTISEIDKETNMPDLFRKLPEDIPNVELVLKAYYRFISLKPHREDWLYQPLYESLPWMSIYAYSPDKIFEITDSELGFMYDALYTKAPILYTKIGCVLRLVSFISLVYSLIAYTLMFNRAPLHPLIACYTLGLLVGAVILEIYQIILIPFSDWAIIKMIKYQKLPLVMPCLRIIGPRSSKWNRWAGSLSQFNLLSFCLHDKPLTFSKVLRYRSFDMEIKKYRSVTRIKVPKELKELVVQEMKDADADRGLKNFDQRGQWSLGRHGSLNDEMGWSVKRDFDKSIVIWHIATDICYHSDSYNIATHSRIEMCRLLSNYMMYLLAVRPHMLSSTTAKIVYRHAYDNIKLFLQRGPPMENEEEVCKMLRFDEPPQYSNSERSIETMVTLTWHMLRDAQTLARSLMEKENRWKIMTSVWVEMICYAAARCSVDNHAEQIRRGGGLITHVWLVLTHKTDKWSSSCLQYS